MTIDTQTGEVVPVENMVALDELSPEARDLAITQMLDQAHHWLAHAKEASAPAREIAEFKAFVASAADAARRVKVSKEIQLDADEMVRRAERTLGQAIRHGQSNGEIRRRGQRLTPGNQYTNGPSLENETSNKPGPSDFISNAEWTGNDAGIRDLADDVTDEQFDEAIDEAKSEGNLSRANVVRKVKGKKSPETRQKRADLIRKLAGEGYTSRQMAARAGVTPETVRLIARDFDIEIPADALAGKTRRHDSTRIARETVFAIEGAATGLDLINYDDIDTSELADWATSLDESMRGLNRFVRKIKEMAQ